VEKGVVRKEGKVLMRPAQRGWRSTTRGKKKEQKMNLKEAPENKISCMKGLEKKSKNHKEFRGPLLKRKMEILGNRRGGGTAKIFLEVA